jgi:hypothetical protein
MRIVVRRFSWEAFCTLLFSIALLTAAIVDLSGPRDGQDRRRPVWIAWSGFALFGTSAAIALRTVWKVEERIIISDAGLFDERSGFGVVPWSDIRGARLDQTADGAAIWIELVEDAVRYPGPLDTHAPGGEAWVRPAAAGLLLDLSGSRVPAETVLANILHRIGAHPSTAGWRMVNGQG